MRISTVVLASISMMLGIIGANAHPTMVVRDGEKAVASGLPGATETSGNVAARDSGMPGHD
ncbi:hypothetical protein EDB19DRAFT_1901223 [Suillus lakei]|nr:hypothetical protein EDB19DRAFT_1901223 [Suillus lakei]